MQGTKDTTDLFQRTLRYFGGDELRARVFFDKYALRDRDGTVVEATPPEMWARVAREMASVEATEAKRREWEEKFFWLLEDFRFVPGGRIMFGAGNPRRATLLNCYVIPIQGDSLEDIFEWCKQAGRTYSFGGGVGTDISVLRPRGTPVNNAAITSSGAVSFMELLSTTTGTIGQAGRRGALMITIRSDHPDVLEFTRVKRNLDKVRYANISVRVDDAFMRAVEQDGEYTLRFANDKVRTERTIRARELWDELVRGARDYAEPGVIFWDTIRRWSTSEYNGMNVITTNPCSEIPLEPYGACCLGNVQLATFVREPFTDAAHLDWEALERALRYAVRFLDDVLDYNADKHPLPEQKEASLRSRRIGVGFTGLGDMLAKLRLRYDSEEALAFVDRTFERIKNVVYDESANLAAEKGPFPAFDRDRHFQGRFLQTLDPAVRDKGYALGLRNVALLTVPPVGSGAALAGTTSGIEPIFDLYYLRRSESLSQAQFKVYHPLVRQYMDEFGVDEDHLPEYFVTAHRIAPEMRVRMQATIQKHIDHSISSTVNLPESATVEDVERVYFLAWKLGCKGITVYRAGSRDNILTSLSAPGGERNVYRESRERLVELYHGQGRSLSEIARIYGTNVGTVHRIFKRLGIERRRPVEAADLAATKSVALSEYLVELIEGELLGDGSLRRYRNGAQFVYTTKYYEFAEWLRGQLEAEGVECSGITKYRHPAGNTVFRFQTLTYQELGWLYDKWYGEDGRKRLPEDFRLTPVRLRQWFMGDGSNVTESSAKYIACVSSFSAEDKVRLKEELERLLGHEVRMHEGGKKFYIPAAAARRMFGLIGPCPVACYEYKWRGGEHVLAARGGEGRGRGCEGVLITEAKAQQQTPPEPIRVPAEPARDRAVTRPRPKVTQGRTERIETPRGRVYVTVNEDEYGPCEVFVESLDVEAEATGRLASLCLRSGVDPREVIEQLWRVQSREVALDRSADGTVVRVSTIAQAVALALGRALYGEGFKPDKEFPRAAALPEPTPRARQERLRFVEHEPEPTPGREAVQGNGVGGLSFAGVCPDCGDRLVYENGCANCRSCGYSRC